MVAEYSSLSKSEQALIYLDKGALDLLKSYRDSKDQKDKERRSFRSDIVIKDVESGLEACLSSLGSSSKERTKSDEGKGDSGDEPENPEEQIEEKIRPPKKDFQ